MTHSPHRGSRASGTVVLGLAAMLGAGVFTGLAPASGYAGPWLLAALPLAAITALCCAFSTADQARAYPAAAAGYGFAREQLGPWPARIAGSAHLLSRVAVMAALAGTFGRYLLPGQPLLAGVAVLVAVTVLTGLGVRFTTAASALVVGFVLVVLALVVAACFALPAPPATGVAPLGEPAAGGGDGLVGAAGLTFLAFAGIERIAAPTPPDPRHPARRLRLAVPVVVGVVLLVCLAVGAAVLRQLGPQRLALSPAPLHDAMVAADAAWLARLVDLGAGVAAAAALFVVLGNTRRTVRAMAEAGDLPLRLGRVCGADRTGRRAAASRWAATVCCGAAGVLGLGLLPPATAVGVAACALLFSHAFTNASARILLQEERGWPMRSACLGLALSVLLAMSLPVDSLLITGVGLAAGTALTGLIAAGNARRGGQPSANATTASTAASTPTHTVS
ncbi:amino acid permease [Goodfellowiella coeruleoviolacea]|uniref:amino acid permease n=1 Tax=Goodfellowiella coeruleoviolacea TaxID=334858 RepID=UPI0020A53B30|nr:amino acid permease [Goodfellowiella coeruleoviolacea]